ncbi:MAG TPA: RNA 2',3'-cyclic phosphodiesterase [Mycobacteriales bacterium]|jgi:2'-5' RNA ligase|nr:RNA 2',3'-cyclic phosphodiesterase [Mycobacteriales bacterium]
MRAFVAIVPPPPALAALARAVAPLRAAHAASWVPPERLHLTLAFLGDVAEPVLPRLGDALAAAVAGTAAFGLRVAGGGAFPRPARPRVLWAGIDGEVDALARLARAVRRAARSAGVDVERAPYVPHVTVARVRATPVDGPACVAALDAVRGEPWQVTGAVLMRSVLGPKPVYEPLRDLPFGYQA